MWYKGIFGYSMTEVGMDPLYHAVDAYIQGPGQDDGWWTWYVLLDVYEPTQWYNARHLRVAGIREQGPSSMSRQARL